MKKIKIIRHSERLDRTYPLYWLFCIGQYWFDSPLTKKGHKLAFAKGEEIRAEICYPVNIYTSPYLRTMETAYEIKNIFPKSNIIIEPLLSEYQPLYKHRINLYPKGIPTDIKGTKTKFNFPETQEEFNQRVDFILNEIMNQKEDCCIVTHGEFLKSIIGEFQNKFPDLLLAADKVPYLTTISFEFNPETKEIDKSSIVIKV